MCTDSQNKGVFPCVGNKYVCMLCPMLFVRVRQGFLYDKDTCGWSIVVSSHLCKLCPCRDRVDQFLTNLTLQVTYNVRLNEKYIAHKISFVE